VPLRPRWRARLGPPGAHYLPDSCPRAAQMLFTCGPTEHETGPVVFRRRPSRL